MAEDQLKAFPRTGAMICPFFRFHCVGLDVVSCETPLRIAAVLSRTGVQLLTNILGALQLGQVRSCKDGRTPLSSDLSSTQHICK